MSINIYAGRGRGNLPPADDLSRLSNPTLYIPGAGLVAAINIALSINQPLLITGEPGSGKTQVAHHLAYYFGLRNPLVFNVQTDSVARDLFYWYDALGHLQYSQTQREPLSPEIVTNKFIHYSALGAAIVAQERRVVLIDEIDKAPRDLPNNILAALEQMAFSVPETSMHFQATRDNQPVVIFTSNSERNLPEAFLRRVVYYHIPFPSGEMLYEILKARIEGFSEDDIRGIMEHFSFLRQNHSSKFSKLPGVAELLYWAIILKKMNFDPYKLRDLRSLRVEDAELLRASYSVLVKNARDLAAINQLAFELTLQ